VADSLQNIAVIGAAINDLIAANYVQIEIEPFPLHIYTG